MGMLQLSGTSLKIKKIPLKRHVIKTTFSDATNSCSEIEHVI